jgi:hypothetical protein
MTDFTDYMNARRAWVLKAMTEGTSVAYPTPKQYVAFRDRVASLVVNLDEESILASYQTFGSAIASKYGESQEAAVTAVTAQLQSTPANPQAQSEFRKQMEKKREEAIESAKAALNKVYDEGIRLGEENPNLQGGILAAADIFDRGFKEVMGIVANFITNAMQQVATWINGALQSISDTFTGIADVIGGWF